MYGALCTQWQPVTLAMIPSIPFTSRARWQLPLITVDASQLCPSPESNRLQALLPLVAPAPLLSHLAIKSLPPPCLAPAWSFTIPQLTDEHTRDQMGARLPHLLNYMSKWPETSCIIFLIKIPFQRIHLCILFLCLAMLGSTLVVYAIYKCFQKYFQGKRSLVVKIQSTLTLTFTKASHNHHCLLFW